MTASAFEPSLATDTANSSASSSSSNTWLSLFPNTMYPIMPSLSQFGRLEDYAKRNSFTNIRHYTDDDVSGRTFDHKGFQAMFAEVEVGKGG